MLLFVALGSGLAACGEELDGGAACPSLCPGQNVSVLDTTFDAVSLDTTVIGVPSIGSEGQLWVATRGDTLDTRAVIRFDSLTSRFTKAGADSAITVIDSAYILLRVNTTSTVRTAPVRIDVYDVDTTAADTATAALRPLFRPDRLIGGTTFDTAQVKDSIKIFLDNAPLLAKITAKQRLRVGIRATSAAGVELDLGSVEGAQTPILRYDPAPADTAIHAISVLPLSSTPTNQPQLQSDLADYTIVFAAPPPPTTPELLSVGGMPARRIFLRFDVPSRILDSSTVLRATLLLTQRPNRTINPNDSVLVVPQLVVAGEEVTDVTRASVLLSAFALDSLRVAPADSGLREIEIVAGLRTWALAGTTVLRQQRAVVLRSSRESFSPFEALFFSRDAEVAVRPRLRVSYALRTSFGIP